MTAQGPEDKRGENSAAAAYAIYGAAGVQLAASVIAGLVFGNYLDKKLGTLPWITIAGLALGFAGGLINLVRIVGWFNKDRK
ncbi:MAG: AtpZ/AtpI family protein [Pseudomonadota bacterium]